MRWITYADDGYREVSDITLPIIEKHCASQGIGFKHYRELIDTSADVYWNRIPITQRELTGSRFLIWSDADIVYNRDFNWQAYVDQFPPNIKIWISSETKPKRQDVCCGFMIFRECVWTYEFLQAWRFLGWMRQEKVGYYEDWNRREQETFNILHDWFDNVYKAVHRIPEDIIANPVSSAADKAACVGYHFWGSAYKEEALRQLRNPVSSAKA
jgi:hypothetical protein